MSLHTLSSVGLGVSERLGNPLGSDPQRAARLPAYSAASPFPRDEQRKIRDIKGKIFLCPLIGGCRGNTRATSASNYFQTLRIERALPRAGGIAQHTHFSIVSTVSIACSAGWRRRNRHLLRLSSPPLATPRHSSSSCFSISPLSSSPPLYAPPRCSRGCWLLIVVPLRHGSERQRMRTRQEATRGWACHWIDG